MAGNARRDNVRFFTMGDARYFLGAVALVNSLRIVGHHEPITFLDLGLTPGQRAILATDCDIVDIERAPGDHPFTFQPYPYVLDPDGVCVIIDSDVIVTQRLDALIDAAVAGKIAAFPDRVERCVPEWASIFHLRTPLRSGIAYVNSGLMAFDARSHREFLARWWQLCRDLDAETPTPGGGPTTFADQDALNALLMSDFAEDQVALSDPSMVIGAPALAVTRIDDLTRLTCSRDGTPVAALHSVSQPKPWSADARFMLRRNAYVRCLRRCLSGSGLTIRVADSDLPDWLRSGRRAGVTFWLLQRIYQTRRRAYNARVGLANAVSPRRRRELPSPTGNDPQNPARNLADLESVGYAATDTG